MYKSGSVYCGKFYVLTSSGSVSTRVLLCRRVLYQIITLRILTSHLGCLRSGTPDVKLLEGVETFVVHRPRGSVIAGRRKVGPVKLKPCVLRCREKFAAEVGLSFRRAHAKCEAKELVGTARLSVLLVKKVQQ